MLKTDKEIEDETGEGFIFCRCLHIRSLLHLRGRVKKHCYEGQNLQVFPKLSFQIINLNS